MSYPDPYYGGAPPPGQYGAPPPGQYGQYGAPPQQYGAPPPQYGAPPGGYAPPYDPHAPHAPQYGAPPGGGYGAPPGPYGAPTAAPYGAPPPGQYGAPQQYGAPPPGQYGAPYGGGGAPAGGPGLQCKMGHMLAHTDPGYAWKCDLCGRSGGGPNHNCAMCKFDMCDKCFKQRTGYKPDHSLAQPHFSRAKQEHYQVTAGAYPLYNGTGRKKALLIGINYVKLPRQRLNGCWNDVKSMTTFLRERGFQEIRIMTDETSDASAYPTKANINAALRWLVQGVQPGDSLFWHYSGHGSQAEDVSGDEMGGKDDTICPADYTSAGQIIDDDLKLVLADPIPPGARLTALMDCCHSGTGMDLPYNLRDEPLKVGTRNYHPDLPGDVFLFAGCRDDQTSADAQGLTANKQAAGAMTFAFLEAARSLPQGSFLQIIHQTRAILKKHNMTQIPQLSYGRPIDPAQTPFII